MEFNVNKLNFSGSEKIRFVGEGNSVYFQKDGKVFVVDAWENVKVAEIEMVKSSLDFFVCIDQRSQLSYYFLTETQISVSQNGTGTIIYVPDKFQSWFFDEKKLSLWFLNSSKIICFDFQLQKFTYLKENKNSFKKIVAVGPKILLFNAKSFQICDLETHVHSELVQIRETITSAALKFDETNKCLWVSLGSKTGNLMLFKLNENCQILFKNTKKWHFSEIKNVVFNNEKNQLFSSGFEDVIMVWDFGNGKTDFVPRFNDQILQFSVSSNNQLFCVILANGNMLVKKVESFATVFENHTISGNLFAKKADFEFGKSLCFINEHLKLNLYKYQIDEQTFIGRQANPTERNIISTLNQSVDTRYTIDSAAISPDESLLVTSESLTVGKSIVSCRLRIAVVQNKIPYFLSMNCFENPHFDEPVKSIHFLVDKTSDCELISKSHSYSQ